MTSLRHAHCHVTQNKKLNGTRKVYGLIQSLQCHLDPNVNLKNFKHAFFVSTKTWKIRRKNVPCWPLFWTQLLWFFDFPKTHAWFSRKVHYLSIYCKNRKLRFFLVENGTIFSSAPEVKLFANWLVESVIIDIAALSWLPRCSRTLQKQNFYDAANFFFLLRSYSFNNVCCPVINVYRLLQM